MFKITPSKKQYHVTLEQDGQDVNIMVDGEMVAYLDGHNKILWSSQSGLAKLNIQFQEGL